MRLGRRTRERSAMPIEPIERSSDRPATCAPLPHQAGRAQSGGEGAVCQQHSACGKVSVEAGIQARRDDVVIHDIGDGCRRGRLARQQCRRLVPARGQFVPARPENRHGVMNRVAGRGMVQRRIMFMLRRFSPYPMTGRVGAAAGRAGPATAEPGDSRRGNYAGQGSGNACTPQQRPPAREGR